MSDKTYIKNTVILFASMALTKIVGALFKIPLANLLGGTGMGYFSTAYGLYSPIFALTAAGVPTVMTRITARMLAEGKAGEAAAVKRIAGVLFSAVGLCGTLATVLLAKPFADHIACSPKSVAAVICIAPAVMLCCMASVLRGYYEGMSDVVPSSAAAASEAISRAVFGLSMAYAVMFRAKSLWLDGKAVFGTECSTAEQATEAALPVAAAGAILAVSISELCGLITMIIADKKRGKQNAVPMCRLSRRNVCCRLLRETAPIAASALVMNCVSFVDLVTVPGTLTRLVRDNSELCGRTFSDVLSAAGGIEGLPNFMYGSYTGIAMSLFMLIPSFAGMTEKTSLPEITSAWTQQDGKLLSESIFKLFRASAIIAAPACFGAAALAQPILSTLYSSRTAEISVCLVSFVILCLGGLFMTGAGALFGVFQAIDRAYIPLLLMIGSVLVKLVLNPILVSIPALNIAGAAAASVAGYFLMSVSGIVILTRILPVKTGILRAVSAPAVCGAVCGAAAWAVYHALVGRLSGVILLAVSIAAGGIVYIILLICGRVFCMSGTISKKTQKNFQKPLANLRKIG